MNTLGERLRELRRSKSLTQAQLAEKIGVGKTTITGYEQNNREPNVLNIIKIAQALDVSCGELIGDMVPSSRTIARTSDEITLLHKYRDLGSEEKKYVHQTLDMIINKTLNHMA